ncbi:MAG: toxic anion resistance protein [Lachnospiraceae bacterium]|nr:toxic anion resistance protein [Lachnospiraceae bacterium]
MADEKRLEQVVDPSVIDTEGWDAVAERLTEEEKVRVENAARELDIHDSTALLQFGASTQKKMSDFSDAALTQVRTRDMGEIGNMLSSLVVELKGFDEEEKGGFLGLFKKPQVKIATMKARFEKAEVNVEKVVQVLEGHQVQLLKDTATLDKMYESNLEYFRELSMTILAGKKKLQDTREGELAELIAKANETGLAEDAQAVRDLEDMCTRLEKKVHDLELTRMIALQTGPQIRLVQDSDRVMVEKIQSTIVNTVPLWKNQMILALGIAHSAEALEAEKAVTDMTNELLKKNAEKLKTAAIETARESQRGVVDMETVRSTNQALITSLDEVMKIQKEGREKRLEAEAEMEKLEGDLREKILEIANR